MKRFHVHVAVADLAANIIFYRTVFGEPPTMIKTDYAKWVLEDPPLHFAISQRGTAPGLDHFGIQVDSDEELSVLREKVGRAEIAAFVQPDATCCYARSDKYRITDPQGISWETFHSLGEAPLFGADNSKQACCSPQAKEKVAGKSVANTCC